MCVLKKYIGDHLEEKVRFSQSGLYCVPADGSYNDYRKYIDALPGNEDPEVFGMHENANIVFQS